MIIVVKHSYKLKKRYAKLISLIVIVGLIIGLVRISHNPPVVKGGVVQVVAAENFWGSLAAQIGGNKVRVNSIVSDPNADPHEYEVSPIDARNVSISNLVILNGAGYDSWATKLISSSPSNSRLTLNVAQLLNKYSTANPHFWYSPDYVNQVVVAINKDLDKIAPNDSSYFNLQTKNLQIKLSTYQQKIVQIKDKFAGVNVGATENIFAYMASAMGLNLVSPQSFTQAVAEGNDPPANSVVNFQQQLQLHQIKILVYNEQTVTPLTSNMLALAKKMNIPIVGITEILQPINQTFQQWMNSEVIAVQSALVLAAGSN